MAAVRGRADNTYHSGVCACRDGREPHELFARRAFEVVLVQVGRGGFFAVVLQQLLTSREEDLRAIRRGALEEGFFRRPCWDRKTASAVLFRRVGDRNGFTPCRFPFRVVVPFLLHSPFVHFFHVLAMYTRVARYPRVDSPYLRN